MEYTKMTKEELQEQHDHAKRELDAYKQILSDVEDAILERYGNDIIRELGNEMTGTVKVDGIKFTIPKNVSWDQATLEMKFNEIGETAREYVDVTYKVSENKYKAWPETIREFFEPARTLKTGKTKIEFMEVE